MNKIRLYNALITAVCMIIFGCCAVSAYHHGCTSETIHELSAYSIYYDIVKTAAELVGSRTASVFLSVLFLSLLWCFYGVRLYKKLTALTSMLAAAAIGMGAMIISQSLIPFAVIYCFGVFIAFSCSRSRNTAAFFTGGICSYLLIVPVMFMITDDMKLTFMLTIPFSVIFGIMTAVIGKKAVIAASSLCFGSAAGIVTACLTNTALFCLMYQMMLFTFGAFFQYKMCRRNNKKIKSKAIYRGDVDNMLFKRNNDTAQTETDNTINPPSPENHRDAVSPSERAIIEAASADSPKSAVSAPARPPRTKHDYLNAPIVKSRPCPLCGEMLEADTIFCPKCKNRVVSRYDEALILRRQGRYSDDDEPSNSAKKTETKPVAAPPKKAEPPKAESKPVTAPPKKAESPKAESKPVAAPPKKAEPPKAEPKPVTAPSKRAEPHKAEPKPVTAPPKKAEPSNAESKPEPAALKFTESHDDELVIKVKGTYTKHAVNPHFTTADDFDD